MHTQHGTLGMKPVITKTRRGRKRRAVAREPNGKPQRAHIDPRALVACQPHRIRLPEALRFDQRAESYLGSLNLKYRISESANAKKRHPVDCPPVGVTDQQFLAGQQYAGIVARYLAMCNAPRLAQSSAFTAANEKWQYAVTKPSTFKEVMWRVNREVDDEKITDRYMRAYEAVSDAAGRRGHMAINRVVIQDQAPLDGQMGVLRLALDGLAGHFGIGGR